MKEKNNPQGKFNKYAIIFLALSFLISAIFNAYLFLSKQDYNVAYRENNKNKFDLLNPARNFLKQEDLIINFQPLRDYLNDKYEADPNVSIYFEYLPTGANIAINKDAEFYPASLLKVPVAMAVVRKIERGEWKWSNDLVLMSTDKDDKFGTLYKKPSNSLHTIEELVERSLSDSDNTAHFMLVRNLEIDEMKDVYDHMGMKGFLDTEGSLSAKRYALIFRALYSSSYINEENSQKILSYLSQSPFDDYLQRGLPKDTLFSHKIGVDTDKKIHLDSGIVYLKNRSYLLTVMTKDKDEKLAQKIMEEISRKVYNYTENYEE